MRQDKLPKGSFFCAYRKAFPPQHWWARSWAQSAKTSRPCAASSPLINHRQPDDGSCDRPVPAIGVKNNALPRCKPARLAVVSTHSDRRTRWLGWRRPRRNADLLDHALVHHHDAIGAVHQLHQAPPCWRPSDHTTCSALSWTHHPLLVMAYRICQRARRAPLQRPRWQNHRIVHARRWTVLLAENRPMPLAPRPRRR